MTASSLSIANEAPTISLTRTATDLQWQGGLWSILAIDRSDGPSNRRKRSEQPPFLPRAGVKIARTLVGYLSLSDERQGGATQDLRTMQVLPADRWLHGMWRS